jgi:5-methyltetrahydrofolate--homocysteine methyltransferase
MIHIFDGAMGTMLHNAGLPAGYCPELWNTENAQIITTIHKHYIESGATIIETNTFGANRIKLSHYGLSEKTMLLNQAAVKAAQAACSPKTKIAGSVGPTGKLIAPLGDLSFNDAYMVFLEQITALDQAGVDMIIIETIIDIQEMRAALLAAKAVTKKPIICQMSFGADGRTVTGTDPQTAAITLEALGATVIGANCSLGPEQLVHIVRELSKSTSCPISVQPNAGMPELIRGKTIFPMSPKEFEGWIPKLLDAGATYIGGCCGTTPEHIRVISKATEKHSITGIKTTTVPGKYTVLTSRSKSMPIGSAYSTAIIGERINPTGRKTMAEEIRAGNYITVKREALNQVQAGAMILDVNMGVPGIDQKQAMKTSIEQLSMLVDVPLAIDTTDPYTLEAGLKAYPGRALINSVTAEPERLEQFLPLAKKYGAAILCLPIAPEGIPSTAQERLKIIRQILYAAFSAGLGPNDFVLDALILTVAANHTAAIEALETLKLYRQHLGYPTTMGLSNISFGLPQRAIINSTFCSMALTAGLDAPILNPYDKLMQDTLAASELLLGHDANGKNYSNRYSTLEAPAASKPNEKNIISQIHTAIIRGEKEAVVPLVREAISIGFSALEITNKALTSAMNDVGDAFAQGKCYLPQVLLAAETMRTAFLTIKEALPSYSASPIGTVLLATVKGDIHDLGKNIVAALMENNGFRIIDLGKDIAPEAIVTAAQKTKPDIIGLCALMTTTMPQIDHTIFALKKAGIQSYTIVGGAVLTEEYAKQAGADAFAANGVLAVNLAKEYCKKIPT